LDRLRGSGWLNAYFRSLGAVIGPRVLLYPTRGDPMTTEPDLVQVSGWKEEKREIRLFFHSRTDSICMNAIPAFLCLMTSTTTYIYIYI